MKATIVDPNGDVRCPVCGAKNNFTVKRTGKAKIGLGLTVGVGAVAAPKRLQCQGCGTYLKQGSSRRAAAGRRPVTSIQSLEGDIEVRLLAVGPRKIEVIKALRNVTRWGLREAKQAVDRANGDSVVLGHFSVDAAEAIAAGVREAGGTVEVAQGTTPPEEPEQQPEASGASDLTADLERLAALRHGGALTDLEYETAKKRILQPPTASNDS